VLQSLLPGFRHLRAPVVAGYVWLLGFWLLFRKLTTNHLVSATVYREVVELANWAGKAATLVAITLVAYLVGTLSIAITKGVNRAAGLLRRTRLEWLVPRYWIDKRVENSLEATVDRRLSDHYLQDEQFRNLLTNHLSECRNRALVDRRQLYGFARRLPDVASLERRALQDDLVRSGLIDALVNKYQYVESAKEDVSHLAYRLLGKEEQVYAEYDRLRSEGTFRLGLVLPLVFLIVVISYIDSWWLLVGLILPVTFAYLAGASFAEAENGLTATVLSGRVELPSLERIRTRDVALEPYEDVSFEDINELPEPYLRPKRRRRFKIIW
jgi:hypothetical protein